MAHSTTIKPTIAELLAQARADIDANGACNLCGCGPTAGRPLVSGEPEFKVGSTFHQSCLGGLRRFGSD